MTIPGWSTTRQLFSWIVLLSILSCVLSQENPPADSKEPVPGSIRLSNGTESSGRIEIFYEGEWGTICDDGWGKTEADVFCRSLGFGNGIPQNVSAGSGKIFLAEVRCKGDEKSFVECSNNKFEPHQCTHEMDAGVLCDAAVTSVARSNSNYVSSCNFEYGTCGFIISSSSAFKWKRHSGSTPSSSTGPSADHTYGSSYGYPTTPGYYRTTTRSSGYPTTPGYYWRTTRSSGYPTTPGYYWRTTRSSGYPTTPGYYWRTTRSSGYPTTPGYYWRTTRSSGYPTTPGYYWRTTRSSGYPTTPGYYWRTTRSSGYPTTPGNRTTPRSSGYYMYTEASSGYSGSTTELTSTMNSQWVNGLSFWYHMYGQTIGKLDVILTTSSGKKIVWSMTGQQGNYWQHACIMVKDFVQGLTFRGSRGSSYTGDIAIDDISFITSSCTSNENGTCTFQNGGCGYQSIRGNYSYTNWNIISGGSYRAPIYDHTTQKSTGRYLSLLNPNSREGMRNYFLSPPVEINKEMKVEFYYYMQGSVPGELQVSFRDASTRLDIWNKNDWQDFGDHGRRWNYGCMDLYPDANKNVTSKRILFTGITGRSSGITLGLDDITLSSGNCGIGIASYKCTFDNPKLCDYRINCTAHHEYTWRRITGRTSSYSTGPSYDAYKQSSGYYLYAEGSYGKAGDSVSVTFPVKDTTGKYLKFNYHMYGQSMGALLLRYSFGKSTKDVWSVSGNQGNTWKSFCVKINEEIDSVVLIAVRGYKFTSDIALDNVFLDKRSCPNSVNCDFENGMCNYTTVRSNYYSRYSWYRTSGVDHTYGSGYYTYVRTNYGEGYSTNLITTNIKQSSNRSSLQFFYQVSNTDSSKLMVQLKNSSMLTEPKYFKMDVYGWVMGCINIPENEVVAANFTVISGVSRSGMVMLDDVYYNEYPCVVGIVNKMCTFDEPNVCGYNVSCRQATQYLWTRGRRSTNSYSTGPSGDKSRVGNGFYMYTESTYGSPGDITDLEFPQFVTPPGHYLSFYYNMNGRDIGSLQVNIITRFGKSLNWMETGHMGSNWMKGCVNLPDNETTTVVFTGIRGNGPLGDIAIDDVSVESGICYPQSIACDFHDEMMCGYRNISSSSNMGWVRRMSFSDYYITTTNGYGNHRLRSPLKNVTDSCIQIYYKITGENTKLDVFTTYNNQKRLSLSTLNSTSWNLAQFYIDQAMTHILIDGTLLYNWYFTSSIKIKNIKMMNGTCPNLVCPYGNTAVCADQSQCINKSLVCDRVDNCIDKSDEANCTKTISCDFEDKYLCGYQFQYGWYHTQMSNFGNPDLYLNNSEYSMSLNSGKAILTSPQKKINESCLQFHYAGGTGSRLEVKTLYANNVSSSRWSISFTDLTKWTIGQFDLPAGIVSIEFIGGASTLGLVIDNVKLQEGKCGEIVCSNDTVACKSNEKCYSPTSSCNRINDCHDGSDELNCPTSLTCDVEHSYQCGYQYAPGTWSVESGRSMLYPDLDHSLGLYSGHYFVSNFTYENQSHELKAPEEILSVDSCLTFYYSFYGFGTFEIYDNGILQLKIKPNNINTWQKSQLQLRRGSHNITFTHSKPYNVSQYECLALDSIDVSSGQCEILECEKGWRKCSNSSICIPESKFCDRAMDCPDGKDEYNCTTYSHVRLVGGRNIHQGFVQMYNEGQWKLICGSWPLRNADIVCKELGYNGTSRTSFRTSIPLNAETGISRIYCRGYESNLHQCQVSKCYYSYCTCTYPAAVDCSDTQCESTHILCPVYNATASNSTVNTTCIPKESMCDGEKDCPGGTDEQSCPKCKTNEFQCLNYDCIPEDQRCDGNKDCGDESDEYHCFKHNGVTLSFMLFGKYVPVCQDNLKDQDIANKLCHFVGKGNASVGVSTVQVKGAKFVYTAKLNNSILPDFKPTLAIEGDSAIVNFPVENTTDRYLHFWYHMNGKSVGSLHLRYNFNQSSKEEWTISGNQGNKWRYYCKKIDDNIDSFSLIAVRGSSFLGDIAIDNVRADNEQCLSILVYNCQQLSLKCNQRECGSRSPNLYDPLIQHGHKALAGEFPWQVSLFYGSRFTCGGILIDDEYVLTAAHCVTGYAGSYSVNVGSTLRYGGQNIRISKIMSHRNYSSRYIRNDIALLKLASSVKMTDYIRPACLPSKPWKPHTLCYATGWGRMEDNTSPNDLMETKVYILSRKVCKEHYRYSDETTICANHKQPNQPGCYGDSGGPMVCRNEQGYWEAVGIFSYGRVQCAGHNSSPQVFADVYTFRDWILNLM